MQTKNSPITVAMPSEMRSALEEMASSRGETISLIVRDLVRQAIGQRPMEPRELTRRRLAPKRPEFPMTGDKPALLDKPIRRIHPL